MIKNINYTFDSTTWKTGSVPRQVQSAPNPWLCDIRAALCFAAIWSRPPPLHGFSLSDTWAWLRYFPAISNCTSLKLKREWTKIDAHQKTIMSDDFGVGCSTWWLYQNLGYIFFCESRYFVNQMPKGFYKLDSKRKRGPSKSPDFIALGPRGICVLECKGTQGRADYLKEAMDVDHGKSQKAAFHTLRGPTPTDSLVIGLLLAQYNSSHVSTIAVDDPPLSGQGDATSNEEACRFVKIVMAKVYLAKMLCLLNQPHNARLLLKANTEEIIERPSELFLKDWHNNLKMQVQHEHYWRTNEQGDTGQHYINCKLEADPAIIDKLLSSSNLGTVLEENAILSPEKENYNYTENSMTLSLPFGFKMSLSIE